MDKKNIINFNINYDKSIDINILIYKLNEINCLDYLNRIIKFYNQIIREETPIINCVQNIIEILDNITNKSETLLLFYNNQTIIRMQNNDYNSFNKENSILDKISSHLNNMKNNNLYFIQILNDICNEYILINDIKIKNTENNEKYEKIMIKNKIINENKIIKILKEIIQTNKNFTKLHIDYTQIQINEKCCIIQ
jgi:hypothetical protein